MAVRQVAVFVENKAGRLAQITGILGKAGIQIRGFSVADMEDFGICRILCDQPDLAAERLKESGFTVRESTVLCVDVPDVPGALAGVLDVFGEQGINIEYLYSAVRTLVTFGVADPAGAEKLLEERGVKTVDQSDLQ